jgi:hypothetical protein
MLVDTPVHISRTGDVDGRNSAAELHARRDQRRSMRTNVEDEEALFTRKGWCWKVEPPAGFSVDEERDLLLLPCGRM